MNRDAKTSEKNIFLRASVTMTWFCSDESGVLMNLVNVVFPIVINKVDKLGQDRKNKEQHQHFRSFNR